MCKQVNTIGFKAPFDKHTFKELKRAYNQAILNRQKSFVFMNNELLIEYAYYLLKYLDSRFKS
jgi:hypothetical protein